MAEPKPVNECTNPFINISGGSFELGTKGTGPSDKRPTRNVTMSSFELQEHEVSVGDIKKANETAGKLQAILTGCNSNPDTIAVIGREGETQSSLERRAKRVAGTLSCNKDDITFNRQPLIEIPTKDSDGHKINDKGDEYPVAGLLESDAKLYCESIDATLPSAAQIEYASDKGGATPNAVTFHNSGRTSAAVCGPEAERRNNRDGVRDLEGNLWEMTGDQYDIQYYTRVNDGDKDPQNLLTKPKEQNSEVRGGSFARNRWNAQAAFRGNRSPGVRSYQIGFRCARPRPQDF